MSERKNKMIPLGQAVVFWGRHVRYRACFPRPPTLLLVLRWLFCLFRLSRCFSGSAVFRAVFCFLFVFCFFEQRTAGIVLIFVPPVSVTRQSCFGPSVSLSAATQLCACVCVLSVEPPMHIQLSPLAVLMHCFATLPMQMCSEPADNGEKRSLMECISEICAIDSDAAVWGEECRGKFSPAPPSPSAPG